MSLMELADFITEKEPSLQKKYKATAYLERCLRGAMDGIDTDDKSLLDEFVWENCQAGYTCEVICTKTGSRKVYYAEKFTTETMSIEELLGDLHLEQCEQM